MFDFCGNYYLTIIININVKAVNKSNFYTQPNNRQLHILGTGEGYRAKIK